MDFSVIPARRDFFEMTSFLCKYDQDALALLMV